jgi:hypothetical protein
MDKARDIFIFCTFTGLSYTDVKFLTYDNIQSSFDGQLWIKGRRKKTGIEFNIPLLNIPKMISDKSKTGQKRIGRCRSIAITVTINLSSG